MGRRFTGAFTALVLATSVAACGDEEESTPEGSAGSNTKTEAAAGAPVEKRKIALVDLGAAPVTAAVDEVVKAAGEKLGWEVQYTDAQVDPKKAAAAIQAAVTQNVDAIVNNCVSQAFAQQAFTQAKQKNIPVIHIACGAEPPSPLFTASYDEDETKLAETLATYILEKNPEAKIGALAASVVPAGKERNDALSAAVEGSGAEIVKTVEPSLTSANPVASTTRTVANMLQANPSIDSVWVVFDNFMAGTNAGIRQQKSDAKAYSFFATEPNVELLEKDNPLEAVADNLLPKTGAIAMDQLLYHFETDAEIDPDALEKDPLPLQVYDRSNLPEGGVWNTEKILQPFYDKWAKDFKLG